MVLFDLTQSLLNAQQCTSPVNPTCPAVAFHPITAAFATQGYWMMADLVQFLQFSSMKNIPLLIYVISAIAGICSYAFMGQPPKMWVWFFVGPGLFRFLIGDTLPVHGVRVTVGAPGGFQDTIDRWTLRSFSAQQEVWKLAEPGLKATHLALRGDILNKEPYIITSFMDPQGGPNGNGTIEVPTVFVKYDALLSSVVGWMIEWTGIFDLVSSDITDIPGSITGLLTHNNRGPYHMISTKKWEILEDITSAKLSSGDLRDAFMNFWQSECGAKMSEEINSAYFVAASNARGDSLPAFVFKEGSQSGNYKILSGKLKQQSIPAPPSLIRMMRKSDQGAFQNALDDLKTRPGQDSYLNLMHKQGLNCQDFLTLIVAGFRWEAGHIYYQLLTDTPSGMSPADMIDNLLSAWNLRPENQFTVPLVGTQIRLPNFKLPVGRGDKQEFLKALIFVHLWRNEFALAPQPIITRRSGAQEAINYSLAYQRAYGSKAKFSEMYTWALMVPHLLGIFYCFLTFSFPFICALIIVPGLYVILRTWAQAFACCKFVDLSLAIVTALEKVVFNHAASGAKVTRQFARVLDMGVNAPIGIVCKGSAGNIVNIAMKGNPPESLCTASAGIAAGVVGGISNALPTVLVGAGGHASPTLDISETLRIVDRTMALAASMDLDLVNSYYIYIMAALYFAAIPLTVQVFLMGKGSVVSAFTQMFNQMAQDVGKASGQGYVGAMTQMMKANAASVRQAAYAQSMRDMTPGGAGEAALKAMEAGNKAMIGEVSQGALKSAETNIGRLARVRDLSTKDYAQNAQFRGAMITANAGAKGMGAGIRQADATNANAHTGGDGWKGIGTSVGGAASSYGEAKRDATWALVGGGVNVATTGTQNGRMMLNANEIKGASYDQARLNAISQYTGAITQSGALRIDTLGRNYQVATEAQQARLDIDAWRFGADRSGHSKQSQDWGKVAEQRANETAWHAVADLGYQVGANATAVGIYPGTIDPGAKPADSTALALDKRLTEEQYREASFAIRDQDSDPNDNYWKWVRGFDKNLDDNYGEDRVWEKYQRWTPDGAYHFAERSAYLSPDWYDPNAPLLDDHGKPILDASGNPIKGNGSAAEKAYQFFYNDPELSATVMGPTLTQSHAEIKKGVNPSHAPDDGPGGRAINGPSGQPAYTAHPQAGVTSPMPTTDWTKPGVIESDGPRPNPKFFTHNKNSSDYTGRFSR